MMFAMPARTSHGESYDYHIRLDAVLNHLSNDGSYDELMKAGVSERDIRTANDILERRGE